jgi:hypothetical protein
VQPIRSTDSPAHRAFAYSIGGLITVCVVVAFAYAAMAGA